MRTRFHGIALGVVCATLSVVLSAGRAQASVQFTIDSVTFSGLVGNTENLKWSVTAVSTPFDLLPALDVGEWKTFTYGIFSTTDFSLDSNDINDNNDRFNVALGIIPPDPAHSVSTTGYPNAASVYRGSDYVQVNFDDSPIYVDFGDGGKYYVRFLDTDKLKYDGSLKLQAKIKLICEPKPEPGDPGTVPEPGTVVVWSLLGLTVVAGRRASRRHRNQI